MNVNIAIKKRITQLYEELNYTPNHLLKQVNGDITLDAVDTFCAELQITVADFFNSDLFRNLDHN